MVQSFLDPFPWRCSEDLVATAAQAVEFLFQSVDFPFCVQEGLGEGATASPFADEVYEIRKPSLLSVQFGLLEPERVRDVSIELSDFLLDALEDVVDRFRGGKPCFETFQDNRLDQCSADQ